VAVGKLCSSGQAVWQWASSVAVGKLCGVGRCLASSGVGADVRLHRSKLGGSPKVAVSK